MSKSILVIGGAGYVGTVVVANFLRNGYFVTCLDSFFYENNHCVIPFLSNPLFRFVYGDFRKAEVLDDALLDVTDVVILAGLVGDPITKKYPVLSHSINNIGMVQCIDRLNGRGLERVIFISTCSNYGILPFDVFADEQAVLNPVSLYADAKVAVEHYLLDSKRGFDFSPSVLRFATAFGLSPRMRFDLTINEFVLTLASGRELLIFDPQTWRPYCHVQDFARLIEIVLTAPIEKVAFEVFNAGGNDNNHTKQDLVNVLTELIPGAKVRYQAAGADPRNYRVNFAKARDTLGFEPRYSVVDGMVELLKSIDQMVFDRVDQLSNFYGNYSIEEGRW